MSRSCLIGAVAVALLVPAAGAQDLPESSPKALMHHAQGIEAYLAGRNAEAIQHFVAAHESDPTSYASLIMAGVAAGNAGQGARADSFYALVVPHKEKLSAYYRYRLEAQMAGRAGKPEEYIAANRRAAEIGPGTKAWYNVAQGLTPRGLAHEAREALRKLDPEKEPMKGWYSYYSVYAGAAHQLGDYEDELAMARRGRAAFPGDIRAADDEAQALAALGRVADAEKVLAEVTTLKAAPALDAGDVLVSTAQEFTSHGNAAAGKRALENALKWYATLSDSAARAARSGRAYALYTAGRYREAAAIYDSLAAEFPNNNGWKAWGGLMAALTGNRARANEVAAKIESGEIQQSPTNSRIWRGLIAAALNDRDRAVALLQESGMKPRWMHRDPVLMRTLQGNAVWAAYLKVSQ